MHTRQTLDLLHELRLLGMAEAYRRQLQDPEAHSLDFDTRFGMLVEAEQLERANRRFKRLLAEARLRIPATPEGIDYHTPRGLSRSQIAGLVSGGWIAAHQIVLCTGPTGVGKTYLVCALAHAACRLGYSARYYRMPQLLDELQESRQRGTASRLLSRLSRVDVLVLDDWGLTPITAAASRDLLEIFDARYMTRATCIASQIPPDAWHSLIQDPTLADAILDRIIHHAHRIELHGESMRKLRASLHLETTAQTANPTEPPSP